MSPLRVIDADRPRRDGGQASHSSFQPCYRHPFGQHRQGSAAVAKCHPWFLILARLPGQRRGEPQALLTSRVARSLPTCHPEVEVCKVWFVSAATSRTPSYADDENREDQQERVIVVSNTNGQST